MFSLDARLEVLAAAKPSDEEDPLNIGSVTVRFSTKVKADGLP